MKSLPYRITSNVWLNLENYFDSGLSQSEIKEVIENLHRQNDLFPKLSCRCEGLNGNLIITDVTCSSYIIDLIVDILRFNLDHLLYIKSNRQ